MGNFGTSDWRITQTKDFDALTKYNIGINKNYNFTVINI